MALDLGLPLLPVSIVGTHRILPNRSLNLLPGRARLVIHPPVATTSYSKENIEDLVTRTRSIIAEGLERHRF
jgi:1-acyl-sn-glycerol-3-phosphate acyltransferase